MHVAINAVEHNRWRNTMYCCICSQDSTNWKPLVRN